MAFTPEEREKLRRRCKTDLHFFLTHILKMDTDSPANREMCAFYPVYDPDVSFKEWAKSYKGAHDYMMLVPRNTHKSYIKVGQNIQTIITFPEIRIITLTATQKLAKAFVEQLTGYFVVRGGTRSETGKIRGGYPTTFQQLFPEHCITEAERYANEFTTPVRASLPDELQTKEPSIGALSIESAGSGWHCDILDNDDPVSDANAETGNQLSNLDNRISMAYELLMAWGLRFTVATRYHPMDPYGSLARDNGVTFLYGDYDANGFKYMCRPCWWLKGSKTYEQPDYAIWEPKAEDVDLYMESASDFDSLRKKMRKAKTFFSQQLNNPQASNEIIFTEQKIRNIVRDHTDLPKRGRIFSTADIAYTVKSGSDHSVICTGLIDEDGRVWIINITRGKWRGAELALKMVQTIHTYGPEELGLEASNGFEFLTSDLERFAKQAKVDLCVRPISLGMGTKDQKNDRIGTLDNLIMSGRLFILRTAISPPNGTLEDLILEAVSFPEPKAKNDMLDAISLLTTNYLPIAYSSFGIRNDQEAVDRAYGEMAEQETFNMIYGEGAWERQNEQEQAPKDDWEDPFGKRDPYTGLPSV